MSGGYKGRHNRTRHYHPRHRPPARSAKLMAGAGVTAGSAALVTAGVLGSGTAQAGTLPAHPAAKAPVAAQEVATRKVAPDAQKLYVVRSGDTLSSIARHEYGHASRWPALWYVNRHQVHNPDAITAGERLVLSDWHPAKAWLLAKAVKHIPAPPVQHHAVLVVHSSPPSHGGAYGHPYFCGDGDGDGWDVACHSAPAAAPVQAAQPAAQPVAQPVSQAVASYSGAPGSFQACVIRAESGGNPGAVNASSGAGGLYQFLPSTWAALGFSGSPQNASVAEQNAAFQKAYAQSGTSPWAPYDGC